VVFLLNVDGSYMVSIDIAIKKPHDGALSSKK
jgi:hypothetical protein